ncbi:MAG: PRTRC system ParB family protein [Candidatus Competibacteraceae bacterium]|nr:PRTRC system ParB family protein [Candidatus Competibacteraceae bacterium]
MNAPTVTSSPADTLEDHQLEYLPLAAISAQPNFNPRTFFADAEFRELVASIKTHGVLQPIVVRPQTNDPTRYWLIAGERRWRAASEAGLEDIPAVVRHVDERTAFLLASIENTQRADISSAEEAQAARRVLDGCESDQAEAIKMLGWSESKFKARLLLLHATPDVLRALTERRIKLGHAELLAGLPTETQAGTLAKIIEQAISVSDLKARIGGFALDLAKAIFDKTECLTCPHNSSLQASLFQETITEGRCQNRACFQGKTQTALDARKQVLAQDYPVVFFDTEKAPETYTVLAKQGDQGVGEAQFAACQGCAHHGALLNTAPGREGQVLGGLCFNLPCNAKMVKGHQAEGKPASPTAQQSSTAAQPGTAKSSQAVGAAQPKGVIEAVDAFFRATVTQRLDNDADLARAYILYAVLKDAGFPAQIMESAKLGALAGRARLVPALYALDATAKASVMQEAVAYIAGHKSEGDHSGEMVKTAVAMVAATKTPLSGQFILDDTFLKAHTKAGITALLSEAPEQGPSFRDWWNQQQSDSAAFQKLTNRPKDDLIQAVLSSRFDFSTFVPQCVSQRLAVSSK